MKTKAKSKAKSRSKAKTKSNVKTRATSAGKSNFAAAAKKLEAILMKYQRGGLEARTDVFGQKCLIGPATETSQGREVWFGAVGERKNYVSYHLMPVYAFPELLKKVSPELEGRKKRMQGKSCFNFNAIEVDENGASLAVYRVGDADRGWIQTV